MFTEGIVKTYNEEKGFGFIQIEDQKRIYFFILKTFQINNSFLKLVKIKISNC